MQAYTSYCYHCLFSLKLGEISKFSLGDNPCEVKNRHYHCTFLADRTNGRAYATVLRMSVVVVCNVMYCG